jgi:hypothetical protein
LFLHFVWLRDTALPNRNKGLRHADFSRKFSLRKTVLFPPEPDWTSKFVFGHCSSPTEYYSQREAVVAPIIEARRFRVRVPGHALRDLDTAAIRQVIGYARGAEGVAAYRRLNAGIGSTAADHALNSRS